MSCDTLEEFIKTNALFNGMCQIGRYYWETRDLDITEIAQRVRADIKNLIKQEGIPNNLKYSVKTERYAGGQSVTIFLHEENIPKDPDSMFRVRNHLEYILDSYNYDFSDTRFDYFNRRFDSNIRIRY